MKLKNPGLSARQGTVNAAIAAATTTASASSEEKAPRRRQRAFDDVPLSIRLPKAAHEELRRLNFETRTPIHSMILEGIAMYLKANGAPPDVLQTLQ